MKSLFKFYEQVKLHNSLYEQDDPQQPQQNQQAAQNPVANDTSPEEAEYNPKQTDSENNELSEPAHDPKLEEIIKMLNDSLKDLQSSKNKKLVQDFLDKLSSPSDKEDQDTQNQEPKSDSSQQPNESPSQSQEVPPTPAQNQAAPVPPAPPAPPAPQQ